MKKVLISIDWSENAEKAFDCKYNVFRIFCANAYRHRPGAVRILFKIGLSDRCICIDINAPPKTHRRSDRSGRAAKLAATVPFSDFSLACGRAPFANSCYKRALCCCGLAAAAAACRLRSQSHRHTETSHRIDRESRQLN